MASDVVVGGELEFLQQGNKTEEVEDTSKVVKDTEDAVDDLVEENPDDEEGTDSPDEEGSDEGIDEDAESEEVDEETEAETSDILESIKARDPKLLKEIPGLRKVIFREAEYSRLLPTIEDARVAVEAIDTLQTYERDLAAGNSENLLEALSKNKSSFKDFLGNFLPTLEKQDENAYLQVVYPELKKAFRALAKSSDENIAKSARNMHIAIFGNSNFDEQVGFKPKVRSEDEENLNKEKENFEKQKFEFFATDVETSIQKSLKNEITKSLANTGLTKFVQEAAITKMIQEVDKLIVADKRHMGNMNSLWQQAKRNGFTPDWKDKIKIAYLSRAKGLLSQVRQRVLSDAGAKITDKRIDPKKQPVRVSGTNTVNNNQQKVNVKDIDWGKKTPEAPQGYSEQDFVAGKTPPLKARKN